MLLCAVLWLPRWLHRWGVAQRGRGSAAREAQRESCSSSSSLPGGGTVPLIPCLHPLCSELFTAIQHFSREERLSTYQQVDL